MTVGRGVGADFSRTCEGCGCITVETVAGLLILKRNTRNFPVSKCN